MRTIWLVGMMGAGKSTVGPILAKRLGIGFVDTDALVERAAGASIRELFAREGEPAFRKRERDVIEKVAGQALVVALGGGAITQPGIRERLGTNPTIVYLRTSPKTLLVRVGDAADRPILQGLPAGPRQARIGDLLVERSPQYELASLVVDTDALSPEEVADQILSGLEGSA